MVASALDLKAVAHMKQFNALDSARSSTRLSAASPRLPLSARLRAEVPRLDCNLAKCAHCERRFERGRRIWCPQCGSTVCPDCCSSPTMQLDCTPPSEACRRCARGKGKGPQLHLNETDAFQMLSSRTVWAPIAPCPPKSQNTLNMAIDCFGYVYGEYVSALGTPGKTSPYFPRPPPFYPFFSSSWGPQ